MKKNFYTISGNDINKFMYCNYQWYYQKVFGIKKLRELRKEYIEDLGIQDETVSNYKRGTVFHKRIYFKYRVFSFFIKFLLISILSLLILYLLNVNGIGNIINDWIISFR